MSHGKKGLAFGMASVDEVIEMHGNDCSVTWLVDKMIEHQAPCLLHAQPKCCKTTLAIDLAIACATGGKWLGRQAKSVPVLVISVENGAKNLVNTMRLLCKARGVSVPGGRLHLGPYLDNISDDATLLEMSDYVRRNQIGLVIFDPAYLILGEYRQTEMNDVGGKLYRISNACNLAGATCMFLHHSKGGNARGLRAAAGAGFANWPSSWLSVSRLGKYNLDGKHRLRLEYGGRWAQQGTMNIHIDEGIEDDVATKCEIEASEMVKQQMLFPEDGAFSAPRRVDSDTVVSALRRSGKPLAVSGIQSAIGGSRGKITDTLSELVESGAVVKSGSKYALSGSRKS